ncbi:MAG: hypothetical protein KC444_09585 [Nitrosopumilus sp.]|nr:hypothetical protein [Nitrosopumilus sp.]
MRTGTLIMVIGVCMFISGLVMFYSVEIGQKDQMLRVVKNTGTFVGLSGMGVTLAGILLHLINRNGPQVEENFDI